MSKNKLDADKAVAAFRRLDKPYFTEKEDYRQWLDEVREWAGGITATPPDDDGLTDDFGYIIKTHILNAIKRLELALNNNDIPEIIFNMHWLMVRMYDGEISHSKNSIRVFKDAQGRGLKAKQDNYDTKCIEVYDQYKNRGMVKEIVMDDFDIRSEASFYRMVKKGKELQE